MWDEVSHFWAEVSYTSNMVLMIQTKFELVLHNKGNLTHMVGSVKLENRGLRTFGLMCPTFGLRCPILER
jgi:hypothetical protein